MRAMEGVEEAAGRGVSEAQRTLRLMVAGGLLLVACVLGLALSVQHGRRGPSGLEQAQVRVLTPQQVCALCVNMHCCCCCCCCFRFFCCYWCRSLPRAAARLLCNCNCWLQGEASRC